MDFQSMRAPIVVLAVGTLIVGAAACGSQAESESAHEGGSAASQVDPSPQGDRNSPPSSAPSPVPTEAAATSAEERSRRDLWGDDPITSAVDNGNRYEIIKILSRDAIPAIFDPNFITPEEAVNQYRDTDLVIGVSVGDEHRAYHVAYLSAHEIVNDVVGGKPLAVTW